MSGGDQKHKSSKKPLLFALAGLAGVVGLSCCGGLAYVYYLVSIGRLSPISFTEARKSHTTNLLTQGPAPQQFEQFALRSGHWLEFPSDGRLLFGHFETPASPGPHPVIVYCHGGYALGPGDIKATRSWLAKGYAVFVPTWRGENGNAGSFELCYGEVDDLVAALDFVAKIPEVNPDEMFVVGHSIGGILALLGAELSTRPRAVASCGAIIDLSFFAKFGPKFEEAPYDWTSLREHEMRSPHYFLKDLNCPAILLYGGEEKALHGMAKRMQFAASQYGKEVEYFEFPGTDHFTVLGRALSRASQFFDGYRDTSKSGGVETKQNDWLAKIKTSIESRENKDRQAAPTPGTWTSIVDARAEPPMDWEGFYKLQAKQSSLPMTTFFPTNDRWVCVGDPFEPGFWISQLDGKNVIRYAAPIPDLTQTSKDRVTSPAGIAPDGRTLAIRSTANPENKASLCFLRSEDGALIRVLSGVNQCRFLSTDTIAAWMDSSELVSQVMRGPLVLCNLASKDVAVSKEIGADSRVCATPGGRFLVIASPIGNGCRLDVLDTSNFEEVCSATYNDVRVGKNLAISRDGKQLATVERGQLTIWNLDTGKADSHRVAHSFTEIDRLDDGKHWVIDNRFLFDRERESFVGSSRRRLQDNLTSLSLGRHLVFSGAYPGKPSSVVYRRTARQIEDGQEEATVCVAVGVNAVASDPTDVQGRKYASVMTELLRERNVGIANSANSMLRMELSFHQGTFHKKYVPGDPPQLRIGDNPITESLQPSGLPHGIGKGTFQIDRSLDATLTFNIKQSELRRMPHWEDHVEIHKQLSEYDLTRSADDQLSVDVELISRLELPEIAPQDQRLEYGSIRTKRTDSLDQVPFRAVERQWVTSDAVTSAHAKLDSGPIDAPADSSSLVPPAVLMGTQFWTVPGRIPANKELTTWQRRVTALQFFGPQDESRIALSYPVGYYERHIEPGFELLRFGRNGEISKLRSRATAGMKQLIHNVQPSRDSQKLALIGEKRVLLRDMTEQFFRFGEVSWPTDGVLDNAGETYFGVASEGLESIDLSEVWGADPAAKTISKAPREVILRGQVAGVLTMPGSNDLIIEVTPDGHKSPGISRFDPHAEEVKWHTRCTPCDALAVSSQRQQVLGVSTERCTIFDLETGEQLSERRIGPQNMMAFSNDGSRIALYQHGFVEIRDVETWTPVAVIDLGIMIAPRANENRALGSTPSEDRDRILALQKVELDHLAVSSSGDWVLTTGRNLSSRSRLGGTVWIATWKIP